MVVLTTTLMRNHEPPSPKSCCCAVNITNHYIAVHRLPGGVCHPWHHDPSALHKTHSIGIGAEWALMPESVSSGLQEAHQTRQIGPMVRCVERGNAETQTPHNPHSLIGTQPACNPRREGDVILTGNPRPINPQEEKPKKKRKPPPEPDKSPNPDFFQCDVDGFAGYVKRCQAAARARGASASRGCAVVQTAMDALTGD